MKLHTLLPCAALVALAGCASDSARREPVAPLAQVMAEADVAVKAGLPDKALGLLRQASQSYPADKAPWLQMAQMKFERGSYGEAISYAQEGLQRDPDDKLGNSIVAVSGLRLASKALADLTRQNNLSGSLRSEAQELARLLRSSLGEEVLLPPAAAPVIPAAAPAAPRRSAARKPAPSAPGAPRPAGQGSASADPFSALK